MLLFLKLLKKYKKRRRDNYSALFVSDPILLSKGKILVLRAINQVLLKIFIILVLDYLFLCVCFGHDIEGVYLVYFSSSEIININNTNQEVVLA